MELIVDMNWEGAAGSIQFAGLCQARDLAAVHLEGRSIDVYHRIGEKVWNIVDEIIVEACSGEIAVRGREWDNIDDGKCLLEPIVVFRTALAAKK